MMIHQQMILETTPIAPLHHQHMTIPQPVQHMPLTAPQRHQLTSALSPLKYRGAREVVIQKIL